MKFVGCSLTEANKVDTKRENSRAKNVIKMAIIEQGHGYWSPPAPYSNPFYHTLTHDKNKTARPYDLSTTPDLETKINIVLPIV